VEKSQKATYVSRPFCDILYWTRDDGEQAAYCIVDLSARACSELILCQRTWVSVNLVSREIRIPSNSLASALLKYMPRCEAGSALDLSPPL